MSNSKQEKQIVYPKTLKVRQIGKDVYTLVMEQEDPDFSIYQNGELLLSTMSLNKADRYWDESLMHQAEDSPPPSQLSIE